MKTVFNHKVKILFDEHEDIVSFSKLHSRLLYKLKTTNLTFNDLMVSIALSYILNFDKYCNIYIKIRMLLFLSINKLSFDFFLVGKILHLNICEKKSSRVYNNI